MQKFIYWPLAPKALEILARLAFGWLLGMLACMLLLGWSPHMPTAIALTAVVAASTLARDAVLIRQSEVSDVQDS